MGHGEQETLCLSDECIQHLSPHGLSYFSFENPDIRVLARSDPCKFLDQLPLGAILDEVRHASGITSCLQQIADEKGLDVLFVLTGSNHFSLMGEITQSLAGRTGILKLLPFSIPEIGETSAESTDQLLYRGFYPQAHTS